MVTPASSRHLNDPGNKAIDPLLSRQAAEPKVTVFIPVYNAEAFLQETIESVLRQTYPHFELLIVDDGSTDLSREILKRFDDRRIRLESNGRNRGGPFTRNRGVELARGELIAVMDADDVSEPQRLEKQVEFLDSNPDIAAVGSAATYVSADGSHSFLCTVPTDPVEIHRRIFDANCFVHSSVMFRRQAILSIGGYNREFPQAQDYDLFLRLCGCYRLANLAEPLVRYRVHPQQVSLKKIASQRRLADRARHAQFAHQKARNILPENTIVPVSSLWRRLVGAPGTCGSDYVEWIYSYRRLGNTKLAMPLALSALKHAPLSGRAWRELQRVVAGSATVRAWRRNLRWYLARLRELMFGSENR